jgi:hypothetical protein
MIACSLTELLVKLATRSADFNFSRAHDADRGSQHRERHFRERRFSPVAH